MNHKKIIAISMILVLASFICSFNTYASSLQPMVEQKEFGVSMLLVCHTGNDIRSSPEQGEAYAGHSFLVFHNESTYTVRIGHMNVAPDDYVTIGTFGNRSTHVGIWYNIEGFIQPNNCVAISTYLFTEDDLSVVNTKINAASADDFDESSSGDNSADFAIKVWNVIGDYSFTGYDHSNSELYQEMLVANDEHGQVIFNYTPPTKSLSELAYHTTTGVTYSPNGASAH